MMSSKLDIALKQLEFLKVCLCFGWHAHEIPIAHFVSKTVMVICIMF